MRILYYESNSYEPWWNLAVEQFLSEQIRKGDVLLYLWQNDRTVVIGRNQNALRECRADLLEAEGGYLARRSTGGGAVYHDLGNLCFTFAADPACYDLTRQMKVIQAACAKLGIATQLSGRNDIITEDGRKFSGNAFSKTGACQLQHGTVMVDVDREMLSRYLTPSPLKLQAKGITSVRSRVCNLKEICPDVTISSLKEALRTAFREEYGPYQETGITQDDIGKIRGIYDDKYASWEWRYGKTPKFRLSKERLFSWGEVQLLLEVQNMCIRECEVYSDCLDTELPAWIRKTLTGLIYEKKHLKEACAAFSEKKDSMKQLTPDQAERICEVLCWLEESYL